MTLNVNNLTLKNNVNDDPKQNIGSGFFSLQVVTAACHSILNTSLTSPDKKPDWFDGLNGNLDSAKMLARDWIDNIAPNIQSKIPTHVINYTSTYKAISQNIIDIITQNPNMKKDDENFVQVNELLQGLIDTIDNDIIDDINKFEETLKTWSDNIQKAHDNLHNNTTDIQKAEIDLQSAIEKFNTNISTLQAKISSEQTYVSLGAGLVGGGLFLAVCGIAACCINPVWGGIMIGAGVLATIGGSITWGVMQGEINSQLDEIASDQSSIAEDKRMLVSLQGIEFGTNSAVSSMEGALSSLSDIRTMWTSFKNMVSDVVDNLNKAEANVVPILKKAFTNASLNEWDDINEFAMQIVELKVEVQNKGTITA